jgi:hypothetical protein
MTAHSVVEVTIERPSEVVFDLVHDYARRLQWDTLLRRAETIGDEPAGKDVVAVCAARWRLGGLVFATRYVSFDRPRVAAVTLVEPYLVFAMWSASIRHKDLPDASSSPAQRSLVTYTMSFRCRPRWLAPVLEPVALQAFRLETRRRLTALKRHLETQPHPT